MLMTHFPSLFIRLLMLCSTIVVHTCIHSRSLLAPKYFMFDKKIACLLRKRKKVGRQQLSGKYQQPVDLASRNQFE